MDAGCVRFPVKRFPDTAASLSLFQEEPLCISALGPKTENAKFIDALSATAKTIRNLQTKHGAAVITQIEMELPANAGASLAETNKALAGLDIPCFLGSARRRSRADDRVHFRTSSHGHGTIWFQTSHRRRGRIRISVIGANRAHSGGRGAPPGADKIHRRSASSRSKISRQCANENRRVSQRPRRRCARSRDGWNEQQAAAMLEDEDATSFAFDDAAFSWREWKVTTERIQARRLPYLVRQLQLRRTARRPAEVGLTC